MNELIPAVSIWQTIADYFALDTSQVFQTDMLLRYLIQVILLFGSAFFSGSETALFSLSHVDFQYLRQTRHRHAEKLQALLDEPRRLIVSILCGIDGEICMRLCSSPRCC
ncbi:hypothetical protein TBK1r_37350 [Stieleria magnilauensis]|uniref:CNNM transmembrane domain-containing protein n=1 Tax=Stieleria magnilauensis TaxID=2527963 RepID=A0ABX5XRZ7_9BACT|nr:hypothetical protein TBK1r_37350 [Planctomycetes bacterium TBK1r]